MISSTELENIEDPEVENRKKPRMSSHGRGKLVMREGDLEAEKNKKKAEILDQYAKWIRNQYFNEDDREKSETKKGLKEAYRELTDRMDEII